MAKRFALAIGLLFSFVLGAPAQEYPRRPVRLIIPFAPGGDTDVVGRILARELTDSLGQSVIADNRSGSNGILGTSLAAKAAPDGHTLLMISTGLVINPALYRDLPYDAVRDLAPISLIATAPHMLAAHPSVPVKTVKELIAYAKAHPGKLSYSSGGNGASSHLSGAMFNVMAGTRMLHVPYRGTGPASMAAVSGEVSLIFQGVMASLPHVKAGRLNGIATTGLRRSPAAPDLPTVAEAGLPGFSSGGWFAVMAPAGTPPKIIARLHADLGRIVSRPEIAKSFAARGSEVVASTPAEFGAFIRSEIARWDGIVKGAHIRID